MDLRAASHQVTKVLIDSSFRQERTPKAPPRIEPLQTDVLELRWSVMIPTYNCLEFLQQTLESVLAQDPGESLMQIEVVDDCSTDGDVLALVESVGKGRVGYFRQPDNVGSLRNFETCILRAKGKWVHLLHGDDVIKERFYEEVQNIANKNGEVGAVFTNFGYIDSTSQILAIKNAELASEGGILNNFLLQISRRQLIQPPAIVVKRKVYEHLGSFYAVHFGEDWEMWSRIASKYEIGYSPKVLAYYRVDNKNSISNRSFLTGQNIIDITKVINIINQYVPPHQRKDSMAFARQYYAVYCLKVANGLLSYNRPAACLQAKGAFKLYKSPKVYYWYVRFQLMYLLRFKEIRSLLTSLFTRNKLH